MAVGVARGGALTISRTSASANRRSVGAPLAGEQRRGGGQHPAQGGARVVQRGRGGPHRRADRGGAGARRALPVARRIRASSGRRPAGRACLNEHLLPQWPRGAAA